MGWVLTYDWARSQAQAWCDAWNRRDLDAVMSHYADDVRVCSPLVKKRFPNSDGWLRGVPELRAYFEIGMTNAALQFTFEDVRLGHNAATVLYLRESGMRVSDTIVFNAAGQIEQMIACYSEDRVNV
jgi:ketosteroid isomerase-like protein